MTRAAVIRAGLAAGLAAVAGSPAAAQDQDLVDLFREAFRTSATRSDLGNAFQSLTIFGAARGITAANFNVEDGGSELDLGATKLGPSHSFDWEPVEGVRPYVEGTFGYLNTEQTVDFDLAPFADPSEGATRASVDIDTFTFLGGVGAEIALAAGTVARPIFLAGYSHTSDEGDVTGPLAPEIAAAGDGIVFDVRINSVLLGGALEIEHGRSFEARDINLLGRVRYTHLFDNVVSASDPVLDTDGDFGVLSSGVELDGPTGLTVFGRELRWIGFAANTYLPGAQNDALGFSFFFELGGGIEIVDREVISGIEGVSLRGSGIVGDNVTGWSAGLSIEF